MAADEGSLTERIFSINDFPTEITERFLPDLRPRTISTLRLVSPRFRDVFTSDRYYRNYLCHADRLELYCEDLENIGKARDRWWRCLEAEKRRLGNWRNGQPTRVETVQVPSDLIPPHIQWQGKVGKGNNYWVMCELKDCKILLANVTGSPIMTVIDVSFHTSRNFYYAHLLADQVVIEGTDGSKQVFNILTDGSELALKHFFTIERDVRAGDYISGLSTTAMEYRNYYVGHSESQGELLRVWDLKTSVVNDIIGVSELLSQLPHKFMLLTVTEYPFVLLTILNRRGFVILYSAVNVEEKQVACNVCGGVGLCLILWFVKGRKLFMKFFNSALGKLEVRIYDMRPGSQTSSEQLIFHLTWPNDLRFKPQSLFFEPPFLITCWDNKDIYLTSVDEPECEYRIKDLMQNKVFKAVFGPIVLVEISSSSKNRRPLACDLTGKLLFDFRKFLKANACGVPKKVYLPIYQLHKLSDHFRSLSKCVLQNKKRDTLYIYHF